MKRLILICLCLLSSVGNTHESSPKKFELESNKFLVSIKVENYISEMHRFRMMELDVAGVDYNNSIIDLILTESEYSRLLGMNYQLNKTLPFSIAASVEPEYHNPQEIEAFVKEMAQTYPSLTELKIIGKSLEGRNIYALKITDNPKQRELEEPTILFNSMHHSREVMTPEVSVDIISFLLENYNSNADVRRWVDHNEIWVVPMLNVDGNTKVWSGRTSWRKNTRGGYGVDINRNYPYAWNTCNGSSGRKWSQTYRGPKGASEPETRALMGLVKDIRPVFDISYHAYSELVIYPLGCKGERTKNKDVVEGIGKELGTILHYKAGTAWELLYSVDGGDIDWMYGEYQVIPYVLEVNSREDGFYPDYHELRDVTVKKNRAGWQHLLNRLENSAVRGNIKLKTGEQATIKVYKADGSLYQNYKVNPDGTFHIVLNSGTYKFTLTRGRATLSKEASINSSSLTHLQF